MNPEQQPRPNSALEAELAVLLQRLQEEHDSAALAEIVDKTHRYVFQVAHRFVWNTPQAEDVTSEVFSVFLKRYSTIRDRTRLLSWLHGVVLRSLRKCKADPREISLSSELLQEIADHQPDFGEPLVFRTADLPDLSKALAKAIAALPARYQQCLRLLYIDECGAKKVAKLMGISPETVHTYRCRALEQLSLHKELREWL